MKNFGPHQQGGELESLQVDEPRGGAARSARWEDPMLEQTGRSLWQRRVSFKESVPHMLRGCAFVEQVLSKVRGGIT